jgi:hypothetical protein
MLHRICSLVSEESEKVLFRRILVTTAEAFLNKVTLRNSYSLGEGNADSMLQLEYHMATEKCM